MNGLVTSESVSEGHPDKVCDFIADLLLDAYLFSDPDCRVACEVLCKHDHVVLAGELESTARVDHAMVVRTALTSLGYTDPDCSFNASGVRVIDLLGRRSPCLLNDAKEGDLLASADQGFVVGFAVKETISLMPLPLSLAHRITQTLARDRRGGVGYLRPDAKSQVTVCYEDGQPREVATVVVSTQHATGVDQKVIREYIHDSVLPDALGKWYSKKTKVLVNPAGPFDVGGPVADCGLTGRKIVADSYGGAAPNGGGAFSGKDGSKVDRSGAYMARYVARQIVLRGLAEAIEVQAAYAIGCAEPVALSVSTRGTGDDDLALEYAKRFDFRPGAIIERFGLNKPGFARTTNYGHFGRSILPWEQ